jgi:hypothetical protein
MDNTGNITESPWDVLLFPIWIHKKISVKLSSLITAFLFVGLFDMAFSENFLKSGVFRGNFQELAIKFLAFLTLSVVIGAIDVVCTMIPIADFAVMIGRRSQKFVSSKLQVILMKSYSLSHIIFIIPTAFYVYSGIDWENVNVASPNQVRLLFSMLIVILYFLPFIQLAFIYRTLGVKTKLQAFEKLILILTTYFWMQLSGGVIAYIEGIFAGLMGRIR